MTPANRKQIGPYHDGDGEIIARPKQPDLKHVACPQCGKVFRLTWNDYSDTPETVIIRDCPSGGVYDVSIRCPHCDYVEEL